MAATYETALCIIPPKSQWSSVDRLRGLYDKAYGKWPPHVNIVYPFVDVANLENAVDQVQNGLSTWLAAPKTGTVDRRVCLDSAAFFAQRDKQNTLYLTQAGDNAFASGPPVNPGPRTNWSFSQSLSTLRRDILKAMGRTNDGKYKMHLTVGQTLDSESDRHKFLLCKAALLPALDWEVSHLAILIRERHGAASQMKLWGTISFDGDLTRFNPPSSFYQDGVSPPVAPTAGEEAVDGELDDEGDEEEQAGAESTSREASYYFDDELCLWKPYIDDQLSEEDLPDVQTITVSSYNVLGEFIFPPTQERYPAIVKNILSKPADIMALQEVSDDFLSYLLADEGVRDAYPFLSHGPPAQSDIPPLPSLNNIVVLSRWSFEWEWLCSRRRHKRSIVVTFPDVARQGPLVVAAVHLTCGLADGAVVAKKKELQQLLTHLRRHYAHSPWILAGDFNIATSRFTINAALERKAISPQSVDTLAGLETMLASAGLTDAWSFCRHELEEASDDEHGLEDDLFDGEQGATFNPLVNALAAELVGSGFNMRPQRYDRILVRDEGLRVSSFGKFGLPSRQSQQGVKPLPASDHWGVRCAIAVEPVPETVEQPAEDILKLVVPVELKKAAASLVDAEVEQTLIDLKVMPTEEETEKRKSAVQLLREVLTGAAPGEEAESPAAKLLQTSFVLAPVGSYGLGVWTPSSDIDCLCVGRLTSATFFDLALHRLRRAAARDVKILRRVRAQSGVMLELEVRGIKMDLQYCPAGAVAASWPAALRLPPDDPAFALPAQTLAKLKAARDLDYLRRSVPDPACFRLAHRFVRAWAQARGIYAARFGYLGGVQISVLLARVCKLLARDAAAAGDPPPSLSDLLVSFFHHYAAFDFETALVFDPFFHRRRLAYTRTPREPLAILGFHPPALNTSHAASRPSARAVADEFKRAASLLSEDSGLRWARFLGDGDAPLGRGAADFLAGFGGYIRIDVQYWGLSLAKGMSFVGWLESRVVVLLVDLQRSLPKLHARMWPARFVEAAEAAAGDGDAPDRYYQGCYLVGLGRLDGAAAGGLARGTLQTVLDRFTAALRADARYFDAATQWVNAAVVKRAELPAGLVVDGRDWGAYAPGDDVSDDEEDDEDAEASDETGSDAGDGPRAARKTKKTGKGGRKHRNQPAARAGPASGPARKLRPAEDVIKRLRWDAGLDESDFVVGYDDRFRGPMEKALELWKSDQTHEEFIPQHRVLYFRRKSDGVVVWDRESRKDDIFGSGV